MASEIRCALNRFSIHITSVVLQLVVGCDLIRISPSVLIALNLVLVGAAKLQTTDLA